MTQPQAPSSAARIQALAPELVNQIAAGEVIERPASVAKELLENSLDAGATEIDIDVEAGGVRLIRVRDNGAGIHTDDLPLALASHATSKIRGAQDLEHIYSLGFRGEALASIASVARLRIESRCTMCAQGSALGVSDDGSFQQVQPAPHPFGTTVSVRELFYNVPARRKFLRAERTEFSHVQELVRRIALSRFDVSLRLRHNQRQRLNLKSSEPGLAGAGRVAQVTGIDFMEQALPFDREVDGMRLWGWAGLPDYHRPQADVQYTFLNGRMIRDRVVGHAVRQSYQDQVPAGRFAAYLLFLEIPAQQVDVNVHPTKHEVRFRDARVIHDFIVFTLTHALQGGTPSTADSVPRFQTQAPVSARSRLSQAGTGASPSHVREHLAAYTELTKPAASPSNPAQAAAASPTELLARQGDYLLVAAQGRWLLLNGAGASRQLLRLRLEHELQRGPLKSRPLLVPETLQLPDAGILLERYGDTLLRCGFDAIASGPDMLALHAVPSLLTKSALHTWLHGLLEQLQQARPGADESQAIAAWIAAMPESAFSLQSQAQGERLAADWVARFGLEPVAGVARPLSGPDLQRWLAAR